MRKTLKMLKIEGNDLINDKYADPCLKMYKLKAITYTMFDDFNKKYEECEK